MNSGIYAITNIESGKTYIGATSGFEGRWGEHRRTLRLGGHYNKYLQRAWNKYSEKAFEFGVLEYLDNFEELHLAEQFWVNIYREEGRELYNIGECVDCPWRGQERSEEHRQKLSESHMGQTPWNKGKKLSKEGRQKLSEAQVGNQNALGHKLSDGAKYKCGASHRGKKLSKEHRRKISEGNKGKKLSEEHKRNISKAQKGHKDGPMSEETKTKISKALVGRVKSKETKQRMSEAQKKAWVKRRALT